jgi:hypothetical protein
MRYCTKKVNSRYAGNSALRRTVKRGQGHFCLFAAWRLF